MAMVALAVLVAYALQLQPLAVAVLLNQLYLLLLILHTQ
jgi:hypothetical protein